MGVVYLGESEQHGQVAIKVPLSRLAGDQVFRARFRREVLALGRVQGLCTVRVIESDTESARPFLVTEYASGPSLDEHVGHSGPLDTVMLRGLAGGLAEALAAIHRADVVHRDLKPSNVLLAATGPKVIDFGIAQTLDLTRLTRTGGAIGTPSYMAPEQFTGSSGPATDIFAWSLTVAFAASGQPPFGSGPVEVLPFRIQHETPDISSVPEPLRPLVAMALAKDPAKRPTALDLLWYLGLRPDQPVQTSTRVLLSQTWWMPPPTRAYTSPPGAAASPAPTAPLGVGAPDRPAASAAPTPSGTRATAAPAPAPAAATPTPPPVRPPLTAVAGPRRTQTSAPPLASPSRASRVSAPPRSRRTALLLASGAAALAVGATAMLAANSWLGHPETSNGTDATSTRTPSVPPSPSAFVSLSPSLSATPSSPHASPTTTPTLTPAVATASLAGATGTWTIAAIDCPEAGNCTAVGTYTETGTQTDAMFVDSDVNGTWETEAQEAANIEGQQITVNALSCASPGNCVAGGWYNPTYGGGAEDPFIAEEANGHWEPALPLGGAALPLVNMTGQVTSVSCPSAGNCVAAGFAGSVFVADEVSGTWETAHTVQGLDTTSNHPYYAGRAYVSCAGAGNCALAADNYVASEAHGVWGTAQAVMNAPGQADALSCAPDGGCTVGGDGAWTASEKDGVWTAAASLPGITPVVGGGTAEVTGLACTDGGNCDLAGSGETPVQSPVGFTDRATAGTWAQAQGEFNGTDDQGRSNDPPLGALSCSSFGNCVAQLNLDNEWLYELDGTWRMSNDSLAAFAISCPDRNWCAIATDGDNGNGRVISGSVAALANPGASPGA